MDYSKLDSFEIANNIYKAAADIDYNDYTENKDKEIEQIENAIYNIKAIAENKYNSDYWRTFLNALMIIFSEV